MIRKLIRFIIAVLGLPTLLLYIPLFYFMDWLFDEEYNSSKFLIKGWINWLRFK